MPDLPGLTIISDFADGDRPEVRLVGLALEREPFLRTGAGDPGGDAAVESHPLGDLEGERVGHTRLHLADTEDDDVVIGVD